MPQKTKKEKIKSHERKEIHVHETKTGVADQYQAKTIFFREDIRKSLLIIGAIMVLELGLYFASVRHLIPFIPAV